MDHAALERWVRTYEDIWRTPGTDRLGELFTDDVVYRAWPGEDTVEGLAAMSEFWEAERDSPDEQFTMRSEIVAIDGAVGVVRVDVDYGDGESWLDLWLVYSAADGRCRRFEEWPFTKRHRAG